MLSPPSMHSSSAEQGCAPHLLPCWQRAVLHAPHQVLNPVVGHGLHRGSILPKVTLHQPCKPVGWAPRWGGGRLATQGAAGLSAPPHHQSASSAAPLDSWSHRCRRGAAAAQAHLPQLNRQKGSHCTPQNVPRQISIMLSPRKSSWCPLPLCGQGAAAGGVQMGMEHGASA